MSEILGEGRWVWEKRRQSAYQKKKCKFCKLRFWGRKEYGPGRSRLINRGIYCSRKCKYKHQKTIGHLTVHYSGKAAMGKKNPNWKGGVSKEHTRYKARFRAKFPLKARAHDLVKNALASGMLVRPTRCEACGSEKNKPHSHHEDYSRPLDVQWICQPCHIAHHASGESIKPVGSARYQPGRSRLEVNSI